MKVFKTSMANKFKIFLSLFLMVCLLVTPAYASTGIPDGNGEIVVSVNRDGAWDSVGSLSYDEFLQEKEISLGEFIPNENGQVLIRLTKAGGGASHLDAVLLAGNRPLQVLDKPEKLPKLVQKDLDLTEIDETGLTLAFPSAGKDSILSITARIEGKQISQIPFQFPSTNNFKTITEDSDFFSYHLNSLPGNILIDGNISEVEGKTPFMEEFVVPGSGHPSAVIYAWVMNDSKNLYVVFDVTPDNTYDGDKDYTKVYVKTSDGVKVFKVSVPETTWGQPGFTYTSRVGYQHKVYEMAIPFTEIGMENSQYGEENIFLAFAAYGTAALTGDWVDVSAGESHVIAKNKNGTLWGWGNNSVGAVGNGTHTFSTSPTPINEGNNWNIVSSGDSHNLALKNDGTLWAWGWNSHGQLGVVEGGRIIIDQYSPIKVGNDYWSKVAAGSQFSAGIKIDGTLWTWGRNAEGQLGNGKIKTGDYSYEPEPVQIGETGSKWKEVSLGYEHGLAIKEDGSLWAWGQNSSGQLGLDNFEDTLVPTQVGAEKDWIEVSAGTDFSLGLKEDGTLWAWGSNQYGQLAQTVYANTPQEVKIDGADAAWSTMDAGEDHVLAIRRDGTLWAWGNNLYGGQLGFPTSVSEKRSVPTQIGTDINWRNVSAGRYDSYAVKWDGTLWAWGINLNGQLGDGTKVSHADPREVLINVAVDTTSPTWADDNSFTAPLETITSASITLNWSGAGDDTAVTGYKIVISKDGQEYRTIDISGGAANSLVVENLPPNTTYTFRVEARDAAGNWSEDGPSVDATTAKNPNPVIMPGANAVVRSSNTSVTIKFNSNESGQFYYAVVADGALPPSIDTSSEGTSCTASTTTIIIDNLTAGAKDIYIVVKDEEGNLSNVLKIDVPAYVPPHVPPPDNHNNDGDETPPVQSITMQRLGGLNRIYTSAAIAEAFSSGTIDNCILATGCNFPDALSGSSLAKKLNAPVLLSGNTLEESKAALDYIREQLTKDGKLYVLGGAGAVPDSILDALKDMGVQNIERLWGQDRYGTNTAIIRKLEAKKGTPVIITTGENFPDSLSISSAAASLGYPILICEKDSMSKETEETLKTIAPDKIYIIGGTGAVSNELAERIKEITGLSEGLIQRIEGKDRYETALNVARYFNLKSEKAVIATGEDFPDALSGTALAIKYNAPILLLGGDLQAIKEFLKSQGFKNVIICGGTGVLSDDTISNLIK